MKKLLCFALSIGCTFLAHAEVKEVTSESPESKAYSEAVRQKVAQETAKVRQQKEKGELYIPGLGSLGAFDFSQGNSTRKSEQ